MSSSNSPITAEKIREVLRVVKTPGARLDIVSGEQLTELHVQEQSVLVEIKLTELNPLVERSLRFQIEKVIKSLNPDLQVGVEFRKDSAFQNRIGTMIAVGSGKGGVGKSALTVNLAIAFQKMGFKCGILDCDIYGPSIPTMLGVSDQKPMMMNRKIQPIEAHGLKLMSAGFLIEPGQSIVWRGPMIHKLIQQFFQDVNWEGVDILVVDLPPGTGDAPLSLAQIMPLTGAVMVSMPQHLSLIDVHKGISMFHQVKVPILGVIENMSHFECPSCHHSEEIFDRGQVKRFCREVGVPYLGDIPIDPKIRKTSDEGRPFLMEFPDSPAGQSIQQIASRLQAFLKTTEDASHGEGEIKIVL